MTLKRFMVLFVLAVLVAGFATFVRLTKSKANPPKFEHHQTAAATSTLDYLTAESTNAGEATSTLSFLTNGADIVDLHLQMTPSSSLESVLRFRVEQSQDNIDWYGEDYVLQYPSNQPTGGFVNYGSFLHSSTTPDHFWRTPTTTDAVVINAQKKVMRFPVTSDYMRFVFSAKDGSNNLGFWADAVARIQQGDF